MGISKDGRDGLEGKGGTEGVKLEAYKLLKLD